jgi:tetratricopeptide (TPR) repeat protein
MAFMKDIKKNVMLLLISTAAFLVSSQVSAIPISTMPLITQYPSRDVCGGYSDEWSAKCVRDVDLNMIDGRTGNVYDPKGNFIRAGRGNLTAYKRAKAVSLLYGKALIAGDKKDYKAEIQIYTNIIEIEPEEIAAYYNRGLVRKNNLNDRLGAIADFRMAAKNAQRHNNPNFFKYSIEQLQLLGER